MSNPARAPREPTAQQLELSVLPVAYLPPGWRDRSTYYKSLEHVQQVLGTLDMQVCRTIELPRALCVDKELQASAKAPMALAAKGVTSVRVRSDIAVRLVGGVFRLLPEEGPHSKVAVGVASSTKVYASGGVEGAIGRIERAYPKLGAPPPRRPVTRAEAGEALRRCGISLDGVPATYLKPHPLVVAEGSGVMVNPHSDNGFPVLGKWDTPGAAELCQGLALTVRRELEACSDVEGWVREMEASKPWLVALRGKAKADYYTVSKVVGAQMRFYNAFPRHLAMNMQMATQPYEGLARHIHAGSVSHSGIGLTLVRGGAADLVDALQAQLDECGEAYVHVGDDSWVVAIRNGVLVQFALDCSNFDLTQHGDVTREVHGALRSELRRIDPVAAELWHALARERIVVLALSLVRRLKHAGPSGMPLQSKVNDMLMDVMIRRTLASLKGHTEADVAAAVERAGEDMGFSVRLEQYSSAWGETQLASVLERTPFLFIGYYFWAQQGTVAAHCDVARTLAQVPYPSVGWKTARGELELAEAMRLGSISMNLGVPPPNLRAAFAAFREGAVALVERALSVYGDVEDGRLRWAVQENPWAAEALPNLRGLLDALQRPTEVLWARQELPHEVRFVPIGSWADEVDAEEAEAVGRMGIREEARLRPPARVGVYPVLLPSPPIPTHPATGRNDGRPPPTAVWGPNREPRRRALRALRQRRGHSAPDRFWEGEKPSDEATDSSDYSDVWNWE